MAPEPGAPRSLRLLFVLDSFGSGGAQRQMVMLARGMRARRHDVEFFVYHPHLRHFRAAVDAAGVPVIERAKSGRFDLSVITALRAQVQRGRYDLVVSFLDTPNVYAELACLGRRRPPLVVSERSAYPEGRLPLGRVAQQHLHRLADAITVNSWHQRDRMVARFPWMDSRLRTIWNGVDVPASPSLPPANEALRLLAIGRSSKDKNPPALVRAMAICRDRHGFTPHVTWIGRTGGFARNAYDESAELLRSLDLTDRWHWAGERSDVADQLQAHDALVHPSLFEGMPNVVCEALAASRPVLAGRVSENPRLVREGETGMLFDPRRPDEIADAIARFHALDRAGRVAMGRAARRFAEAELSSERYVTAYESLFMSLTDPSTRRT